MPNTLSHVSQVCYSPAMELKSKREAAELLGVSTRGIERAVRRGHLNVVYHDSKHGRKAWFSPGDLERYRQQQQVRGPVGFMTGSGAGPTIGTVIPMVDMQPRQAETPRRATNKSVPIVERLTLTLADAAQLSGLPRKFLLESVRSGALKSVKVGRIVFIKRSDLNEFVQSL
jgi:excisionase family DNA binding protein